MNKSIPLFASDGACELCSTTFVKRYPNQTQQDHAASHKSAGASIVEMDKGYAIQSVVGIVCEDYL
jgi:hypothetical protein